MSSAPPAPAPSPAKDRILNGVIDGLRMIIGLIVAIILAPALAGILYGLSTWPKGGLGEHLREVGVAALLFLFVGIATSFKVTVCAVLPGIILARWTGLMSPRLCVIGGALVSGGIAVTGIVGFASPLDIDWRLIGSTLGAGSLAALVYWWLAERPLRGQKQSAVPS